ncbi:serine hydrolase [Candidatus Sumerlaeota bacterium]|nr:serine hydrolase [Candidatus Sumerlaeota bacterium]
MGRTVLGEESSLPEASILQWTDNPGDLGLDKDLVEKAFTALESAVKEKKVPGAVAVIGRNGHALNPRSFGHAVLQPEVIAMTTGTIFDLASLTKMIVTNTSIMILLEQGKISLDDLVIKYLPEFGKGKKETITIRHLVTHTSGFPAFKRYYATIKGREAFYKAICEEELVADPGTKRTYSDIGFMTLGMIVEKVLGKSLDAFSRENIFEPLGMNYTRYNPPAEWKKNCAATEIWPLYEKRLAWGEVHDENAHAIGGVSGHAGLFSTVRDLSVFCQMLANGGKHGDIRILNPETVRAFYTAQLDPGISDQQGMGWILGGENVGSSGGLGTGSYGHTGFTGTSIWIDPRYDAFAILLMNAIHPDREKADRGAARKPFYQAVKEAMEKAVVSEEMMQRLYPVDEYWIEKTLRQMTLEEKAGQVIVPTYLKKEEVGMELIRKIKPGGLIAYPNTPAAELAELMNKFQGASYLPLLITADFERGVGCYIDGATDLPSNMAIGASGSVQVAEEAARITALESRPLGVHLNFAPVLDVNNNPENPIINIRSFGENPESVARIGAAWIKSIQKHGMLATGKHFPGHGNTSIDSHSSLGTIQGTKRDLRKVELLPFEKAISEGDVSSVMTAHLWLPAYEEKPIPATISKNIMTGVLRREFGFKGILFTDAMGMGGVTKEIPFEESILRSLEAGCDVILMPSDPLKTWEVIVEGLRSGRIEEERIDQSIRKILAAKTRVGLHKERFVALDKIKELVGTEGNYETAKELARKTLTLVKAAPKTFPLSREKSLGVILLTNQVGKIMVWRDIYSFGEETQKIDPDARVIFLGDDVDDDERQKTMQMVKELDQVVIALYPRIVIGRGNVALNEEQRNLLQTLFSVRLPHVVISFGSPYILSELPEIPTYICAYGNARAVQAAAAGALFQSEEGFSGKLPVTILESNGKKIMSK